MEKDDTSSYGSLSPLWNSDEDNSITIGDEPAEAHEHVQVPEEEPKGEQNMFLMEHKDQICSLNQANRPGWDDLFFSTLRRALDHPGFRVADRRVPEPLPQHPQNTVDQHPKA